VATSPLSICKSVPQIVVFVTLTIASAGSTSVGLGRPKGLFSPRRHRRELSSRDVLAPGLCGRDYIRPIKTRMSTTIKIASRAPDGKWPELALWGTANCPWC